MCVCIYIYIYICVCIYIYIYTYTIQNQTNSIKLYQNQSNTIIFIAICDISESSSERFIAIYDIYERSYTHTFRPWPGGGPGEPCTMWALVDEWILYRNMYIYIYI